MALMDMPENADVRPIRYFAVLVDGEFAGPLVFVESPEMEALLAGLESNPTIMPMTLQQAKEARVGFIWNGTEFVPPTD